MTVREGHGDGPGRRSWPRRWICSSSTDAFAVGGRRRRRRVTTHGVPPLPDRRTAAHRRHRRRAQPARRRRGHRGRGPGGQNAEAWVNAMIDALAGLSSETLPLGRTLIRLTVDVPSTGDGAPRRGYRRINWIERAIEPLTLSCRPKSSSACSPGWRWSSAGRHSWCCKTRTGSFHCANRDLTLGGPRLDRGGPPREAVTPAATMWERRRRCRGSRWRSPRAVRRCGTLVGGHWRCHG